MLEAFVLDELTYPNFKSEAAMHHPDRAGVLHEIWDVLRELEEPDARRR